MKVVILIIISYLLGSIPFALIIGKIFYKKDIRQMGSGNLGATNTIRCLGKKAGILVFLLDCFKGFVSLLIANKVLGDISYLTLFGAFAMIGHIFPIFANFKGGKAVATATSIFIYFYPFLSIILFIIFCLNILITGYVSLSSIMIALLGGIYIFVFETGFDRYIMVIMCILVIYMHRTNIIRILNGTENISKLKIKK
ncbi:glycerol-3-phosphate 1-O-acyltransferase PlsY [Gemelliphila asaccharolytica]|uniref:Glycerol-3-phosphate acyltransferase n=1 Tax=Gemelliphila asaccharolytica TaxID=502393 RepID=A0ABR5TLL6_9BACL|nr:glycerol-3-phosphate 1-O-acyltransferase PlsY [Gemella asaccharolytica]KXB57847.1 acyl-phosphate glycerol 3-phosphate acyltransferase [Gemella asaccharolytica]